MWVKMKVDVINQDKGYLEAGNKYNLPKDLAKALLENGKACSPDENQAIEPSENK